VGLYIVQQGRRAAGPLGGGARQTARPVARCRAAFAVGVPQAKNEAGEWVETRRTPPHKQTLSLDAGNTVIAPTDRNTDHRQ
jgi:hypothetical protein